jgi:hypothetical protein
MPSGQLDLEQAAELAAQLRALLAQVDASRLDATPTMRARLEGALVALEATHRCRRDQVPDSS